MYPTTERRHLAHGIDPVSVTNRQTDTRAHRGTAAKVRLRTTSSSLVRGRLFRLRGFPNTGEATRKVKLTASTQSHPSSLTASTLPSTLPPDNKKKNKKIENGLAGNPLHYPRRSFRLQVSTNRVSSQREARNGHRHIIVDTVQ